jgi:hypothetical protein
MSMSNAAETALLQHYFQNTSHANVGNAGGLQPSAVAGNFYIALHTADPGEAGSQATSECAYTSYARVAVPRSGAGFTVATDTVTNAAIVEFPQCTGGIESAEFFSIGLEISGATVILLSGQLTDALAISNGVKPTFAIGALEATVN